MLLGRMCMSEGAFVAFLCIFIERTRMVINMDAHSQARASFLETCVQRWANSIDFRACDFVSFGWENGPFGDELSTTLGRGAHFERGGTQEGSQNT